MTSIAENRAQNTNIVSIVASFIKTVPRRGPIIKPMPKIAPRSPKFLLRSSVVVDISARIAWMILIFPPVRPFNMRDMRYHQ